MNLFIGILLILGMMVMIFLVPEWILGIARGFQDFKDSGVPH